MKTISSIRNRYTLNKNYKGNTFVSAPIFQDLRPLFKQKDYFSQILLINQYKFSINLC